MIIDYSNVLKEILSNWEDYYSSINKERFSTPPAPGKWSGKEILGHLIDSAINNHLRFIKAIEKEEYIFDGYQQEEWVIRNNYKNRNPDVLSSTFTSINRHIAEHISTLSNDLLNMEVAVHNFDRICMIPLEASTPATLKYLIHDYVFHLEHHLTQINPEYARCLPDMD